MTKPYVIGIAGGSASGKSTFCAALEKELAALRVLVLHMDDYFKPEDQRPQPPAPITQRVYIDNNHPETMNLAKLKQDLRDAVAGNACDIIIVEGLLTLYDDGICAELDLKLFVECRADERIVRRLKRNMAWGEPFDKIADVYLDMVRYRHDEYVEPSKWKADMILNGSNSSTHALSILSEAIQTRVMGKDV